MDNPRLKTARKSLHGFMDFGHDHFMDSEDERPKSRLGRATRPSTRARAMVASEDEDGDPPEEDGAEQHEDISASDVEQKPSVKKLAARATKVVQAEDETA